MKKLWIPIVIAALLLTGCLPQPDATTTLSPSAGQTAEVAATAAAATASPAATPAVSPQTAAPTPAPTPVPTPVASAPSYWPSEIPSNIPVFNYGEHVQTTKSGGEVTIVFSGVSKEDYAQYRDILKNSGFFLAAEDIDPVGVSEFTMNGPNCVITLRVTKDDFAEWKYTPAG